MKIFQKYIIYNYLKNFFIILFALEFFYVGIDLLTRYQQLPKSANLELLYVLFQAVSAINFTLPLSVVFAMIVTMMAMVKTSELVSLYSFGISRNSVAKPLFFTSLLITVFYIFLNFTPFSYAYEYGQNILKFKQLSIDTSNVFLKNGNQYIYIEKLDPIKRKAFNISIFEVKKRDLVSITNAKYGYYQKKNWILHNVEKIIKPKVLALNGKGIAIEKYKTLETLRNFRPKIIDNIYRGKYNLSILDAIDAFKFYSVQELDTNRIKTIIFQQLFMPLFAPFLILIFFLKIPTISRYHNATLFSFVMSFVVIAVWGTLFLLSKLALNSVIYPELAIMLPIFLLGLLSLYSYIKE